MLNKTFLQDENAEAIDSDKIYTFAKVTTQIIITGPPGSGKSALIRALKKSNHVVLPEIAREVIESERASERGFFPWSHLPEFSDIVFRKFMERKKDYDKKYIFTDRGIPDTLSYLRLGGEIFPEEYIRELASYPYHKIVFFAPFWNEIYKVDSVRIETVEEAKAVEKVLLECYSELGFTVYRLPLASVSDRVRYVEDYLKYHF